METTKTPSVRAEKIDPSIENAHSENCNLSILLNKGGLVFSILRKDANKFIVLGDYALPEGETDISNLFYFKNQLSGEFCGYSIGVQTPKFTLVPKALFSSDNVAEFAAFQFEKEEGEVLQFDEIAEHGVVVVYAIPDVLKQHIEMHFHGVDFHHASYFTISYFLNLYKNQPGEHIHAHVWDKVVEVFAVNNGKLVLCSQFGFQSDEDLLYFILNAYEQLGLNPENVPLKVSGELEKHFESWRLLEQYIRFVEIENRPTDVQYSHEFKALSKHKYNRVFQAATCV